MYRGLFPPVHSNAWASLSKSFERDRIEKEEEVSASPDAEAEAILADLASASSRDEFLDILGRIVEYSTWNSGKTQAQVRALAERAAEMKRQRLSKGLGYSEGGILPIPGEEVEQHAAGQTRRVSFGLIPPSEERLGAQTIGSMQIRIQQVELDVRSIREQVRKLVELLQISMSREGANAGNLGAGP